MSVVSVRGAAVAALAAAVAGATAVIATHTNSTTDPTAPAAPTLTKLTRPVTMRWTKSKGATTYMVTRNGVVVATVAANPSSLPTQSVTVKIPCTGNTLSTLRVVARNSGGKSAPSKPSSWRC